MTKPKDVNEYISLAPKHLQAVLEELRQTIKKAAPQAEERISYGMPLYYYKGRVVYFGLFKDHIGLYAMTTEVLKEFGPDLKKYLANKGTIRLPLSQNLPFELITNMVKAQVSINESSKAKI
jgi:uncharacterized protein YdhG (YjbR/CyaY superfamily)